MESVKGNSKDDEIGQKERNENIKQMFRVDGCKNKNRTETAH